MATIFILRNSLSIHQRKQLFAGEPCWLVSLTNRKPLSTLLAVRPEARRPPRVFRQDDVHAIIFHRVPGLIF
jgi:hypothetical protein